MKKQLEYESHDVWVTYRTTTGKGQEEEEWEVEQGNGCVELIKDLPILSIEINGITYLPKEKETK